MKKPTTTELHICIAWVYCQHKENQYAVPMKCSAYVASWLICCTNEMFSIYGVIWTVQYSFIISLALIEPAIFSVISRSLSHLLCHLQKPQLYGSDSVKHLLCHLQKPQPSSLSSPEASAIWFWPPSSIFSVISRSLSCMVLTSFKHLRHPEYKYH